jgi:hypothetical protein
MNDVRLRSARRLTSAVNSRQGTILTEISAAAEKNARKARFPKPQKTSSDNSEEPTRGISSLPGRPLDAPTLRRKG